MRTRSQKTNESKEDAFRSLPCQTHPHFNEKCNAYIKNYLKKGMVINCSREGLFAYQHVCNELIRPKGPQLVDGTFKYQDTSIKRALIDWRTGSGKTFAIVNIIEQFKHSFKPVVFVFRKPNERNNFYRFILKFDNVLKRYIESRFAVEEDVVLKATRKKQWVCQKCKASNASSSFKCQECGLLHPNLNEIVTEWLGLSSERELAGTEKTGKNGKTFTYLHAPVRTTTYSVLGGENQTFLQSLTNFPGPKVRERFKIPHTKFHKKNPLNSCILICDEAHTLLESICEGSKIVKEVPAHLVKKQKSLFNKLMNATDTHLYLLTATPINVFRGDTEDRATLMFTLLRGGYYTKFDESRQCINPTLRYGGTNKSKVCERSVSS